MHKGNNIDLFVSFWCLFVCLFVVFLERRSIIINFYFVACNCSNSQQMYWRRCWYAKLDPLLCSFFTPTDLVSFCDVRLCTSDAQFSIKETQIGIVADLGTLQRIQRITSNSFAREMVWKDYYLCFSHLLQAFTGSFVSAEKCLKFGFVNEVIHIHKV